MLHNLYALLVGIDTYPDPHHRLYGCVNDTNRMAEYLLGRTARERFLVHLQILQNEAATRTAVIEGFRRHLGRAQADDVVLFYYCGHGSQEPAPAEFWPMEPDHQNETLVCWDSRAPSGWDLADKELAQLIAEVAATGPHIVIILDCCHSGSGTRDALQQTAERLISEPGRGRDIKEFLWKRPNTESGAANNWPSGESGWRFLPDGPHILLAACRDTETAKEYVEDSKTFGTFSHFLITTLVSAGEFTTYRDLYKRTLALVCSHAMQQTPQFEASVHADLARPFLGGAIASPAPYFTVSHDKSLGWTIDGGSIHGIAPPSGQERTILSVFSADATADELRQRKKALGTAEATDVHPQLSRIHCQTDQALDSSMTYKAVVVGLPLPPLPVQIEGDEAGQRLAHQALESCEPDGRPSLYVRAAYGGASFRLIAQNGQYCIARANDPRSLVDEIDSYTAESARRAVARLEHIARWQRIADLANPSSRISPDAIKISLLTDEGEIDAANIVLPYRFDGERWLQPRYRIKLENRSNESQYFAVVVLSESFAVSAGVFPGGGVRLGPWQMVGSTPKYARVPVELWDKGITQRTDIFKIITSNSQFDATLLEQDKLDSPRGQSRAAVTGTLNRLMNRLQFRNVDVRAEEEQFDDWTTSQLLVTVQRPTLCEHK